MKNSDFVLPQPQVSVGTTNVFTKVIPVVAGINAVCEFHDNLPKIVGGLDTIASGLGSVIFDKRNDDMALSNMNIYANMPAPVSVNPIGDIHGGDSGSCNLI